MEESNQRSTDLQLRKQILLPTVVELAEAGKSLRAIAEQVEVSKSTIANWLREARPRPAVKEPPDPADEIRESIKMFKSMRQAAYDEWRLAKADKQVKVVEHSGPADGPADKIKTSVRTETRTGNTAYFRSVMQAQDKMDVFEARLAAIQGLPAAPADRLANLSDDDLENLSAEDLDNFDDDELYAMDLRLRAKHEREGQKFDRPVLTNEEIRKIVVEAPETFPFPEPADAHDGFRT